MSRTRNPERSRQRILAAALEEFSRKGFAGARVDAVARRAHINKRMLYHYYGSKDGLFREVLRRKLAERAKWLAAAPEHPAESLPYWYELICRDRDWIRLLEWEALESSSRTLVEEEMRRQNFSVAVTQIRRRQQRGLLSRAYPAEQILLSMMALTTFPIAFPQLAKLATGLSTHGSTFKKRQLEFLKSFAAAFCPSDSAAPAPARSRREGPQ